MDEKSSFIYFNYSYPVVGSCDSLCMIVKSFWFFEIFNSAILWNKKRVNGSVIVATLCIFLLVSWSLGVRGDDQRMSRCRDAWSSQLPHSAWSWGGGELPSCWSDRSDPAEQILPIWRNFAAVDYRIQEQFGMGLSSVPRPVLLKDPHRDSSTLWKFALLHCRQFNLL